MSAVLGWVAAKASAAWVWALGALAALALLATLYASVRKSGATAEKEKAQGRVLDAVKERHEVDDRVARDPAPVERLRERWTRD